MNSAYQDGVYPTSTTHQTNINNAVSNLLNDIQELKGILLEDYFYPVHLYNESEVETQKETLNNFAITLSETIKDVDSDLKLSGNISYQEVQASNPTDLSSIFDFMILGMDGYNKTNVESGLSQTGDTPTLIEITSHTEWLTTPRPASQINKWFKQLIVDGVDGYALYAYPTIPEGLKFVDSCPVKMLSPNLLFYDI